MIRRGDIYYADLRPVVGSEQGGIRPVIVVQNEAGNRHSSTVIIAAITSKMKRPKLPTHIMLDSSSCDIAKDSVILLEQLRTIDKQRLKEKVCHVDAEVPMAEMYDFSTYVRQVTQGRGSFTFDFVRYEEAPQNVAQKVIEAAKANGEID